MQKFDAIVIGTGQAGPPLAARLVEAGMKVAVALDARMAVSRSFACRACSAVTDPATSPLRSKRGAT